MRAPRYVPFNSELRPSVSCLTAMPGSRAYLCFTACLLVALAAPLCRADRIGDLGATIVLGGPCTSNNTCVIPDSYCAGRICSCLPPLNPLSDRLCGRRVGDPCDIDRNCSLLGPGGYCPEGSFGKSCSCHEKFVNNANNSKCLPVSQQMDSPCEVGRQCSVTWGDQAECRNGTCQCHPDSIFSKTKCFFIKGLLGDQCNLESQICYLEDDGPLERQHTICTNNTCQCETGYKASNDNRKCNSGTLHLLSFSSFLFVIAAKMLS